MNIKNTKKANIRLKLQTITELFSKYDYDLNDVNDDWTVFFSSESNNLVKFMIEISSTDDTFNVFKFFNENKWETLNDDNFDNIITIAENKITELYG